MATATRKREFGNGSIYYVEKEDILGSPKKRLRSENNGKIRPLS